MKKNFDDFLKTLTPDIVAEITDQANDAAQQLREDSSQITSLGNQIGGVAFTFSVELLRLYHEWLFEQDDQ